MRTIFAIPLAAALLAPSAALADANCPSAPKDKWLSEDAMKAKVKEMGYTFRIFRVSGNCYEIYGNKADGKRVEVYFNPVTGEVVKEEDD